MDIVGAVKPSSAPEPVNDFVNHAKLPKVLFSSVKPLVTVKLYSPAGFGQVQIQSAGIASFTV